MGVTAGPVTNPMSPLITDPAVVLVKVLERTAYVAAAPRDGVTAACAAGTKATAIETARNKGRQRAGEVGLDIEGGGSLV